LLDTVRNDQSLVNHAATVYSGLRRAPERGGVCDSMMDSGRAIWRFQAAVQSRDVVAAPGVGSAISNFCNVRFADSPTARRRRDRAGAGVAG
jgi:hypothetical protein